MQACTVWHRHLGPADNQHAVQSKPTGSQSPILPLLGPLLVIPADFLSTHVSSLPRSQLNSQKPLLDSVTSWQKAWPGNLHACSVILRKRDAHQWSRLALCSEA